MKMVLIPLLALFLLAGQSFAAEMMSGDAMTNNTSEMMKKGPLNKDCIAMKGGKMMVLKDGKKFMMDKDMTMSNGTVVMKDGNTLMKNGKKGRMKEGDQMDMNGNMMKNKKATQKTIQKKVK